MFYSLAPSIQIFYMKKVFITLVIVFVCFRTAEAQDKFKPLIERIALLQVYLGELKKGYNIVKDGLNTVNDIKRGEFSLHKGYFNSLKTVNPKIKKYSRVFDIMACHQKMLNEYKKVFERAKSSRQFSAHELATLKSIYSNLMDENAKDLDHLLSIITDQRLEMKDSERLEQIDQLYLSVLDRYQFLKSFNSETEILALQRKKEQKDLQISGKLFNIK